MAIAVRPLASRQAGKPKYLLEPEITILLVQGFTDLRKRVFFDLIWNTEESWAPRPFSSLMTIKPRRPPKDTLRNVPLFDEGFTATLIYSASSGQSVYGL